MALASCRALVARAAAAAAAVAPPAPAACAVRWLAAASGAPAAAAAAAAAAATASPAATAVNLTDRSAAAAAAAESRVRSVYYDPKLALTRRQRQVFASLEDEPPLPLMEDHGFLYRTAAAQLEGRNELVKRALSTRTGNVAGTMAFKRSEILRKYAPKPFDTGASRVQVAMLTERIARLSAHLAANSHDKNCKRSLTNLTVRRRKLLEYMMATDYPNYRLMVRELGLRALPLVNSRHLPKVRAETHVQVKERHARLKNRLSRGHKGH